MTDIKNLIIRLAAALAVFTAAIGCCGLDDPKDDCIVDESARKVLLLYSAGYNSLRNYLLDDINDLKEGWLPGDVDA